MPLDNSYRSDVAGFLSTNPIAFQRYRDDPNTRSSSNFVYDNMGPIVIGIVILSAIVGGLATHPEITGIILACVVGLCCLCAGGIMISKSYKQNKHNRKIVNEKTTLFQPDFSTNMNPELFNTDTTASSGQVPNPV